ncbi:MAG: hypothetical protein GX117_03555 [Candidatus Hydrogenedentes bacterium]|jgi:hypothetical protein|nr:hypothetical protein [Candidatus Hydrogenedentota bacterium]NLV44779.1 hypothetical protein [Candidatus Hydrogenedentota bacterium]
MICIISSLLISTFLASIADPNTSAVIKRKADAIVWSNALRSFSGEYTVYERKADKFFITHVLLSHDGDNKKIKVTFEDRGNFTTEESLFSGAFRYLRTKYSEEVPEYITDFPTDKASFSVPESSIYTPQLFFQQKAVWDHNDSLEDLLSWSGEQFVIKGEEHDVLVHESNPGGRMDIHFDPLGRVVQIDVLAGFGNNKEALKQQYAGNIYDLRWPYWSYIYEDYKLINGVWFPLMVRNIIYEPGSLANSIIEAQNRDEIDPVAASIAVRLSNDFVEGRISEIVFKEDSLILNEILDERYFKIDIPPNATFIIHNRLVDQETLQRNRVYRRIIVGALITGLVSGMLFCIYCIRRRRML